MGTLKLICHEVSTPVDEREFHKFSIFLRWKSCQSNIANQNKSRKFRHTEVLTARVKVLVQPLRGVGISERSYDLRKKGYGRLKIDQTKKLT
ncbi:hypothetical protein C7W93_06405 [Glaciimonas sp. PCH181]|nr:hypothetical protein C7W93_06405 [Glaciimonas sp. PCH181]